MARIALVEDDVEVRLTLGRMLTHGGHQPLLVTPGLEVLETLDALEFDLLITDIAMAFVDGWDILRWTRSNRPATPTLAISGGSKLMDAGVGLRLGKNLGAVPLAKPFRARALLDEVARLPGTHSDESASFEPDQVTIQPSARMT